MQQCLPGVFKHHLGTSLIQTAHNVTEDFCKGYCCCRLSTVQLWFKIPRTVQLLWGTATALIANGLNSLNALVSVSSQASNISDAVSPHINWEMLWPRLSVWISSSALASAWKALCTSLIQDACIGMDGEKGHGDPYPNILLFIHSMACPVMECCHVDDTLPECVVTGFPPGWVDPDVDWLYISINRSQAAKSQVVCSGGSTPGPGGQAPQIVASPQI